MPLTLIEVNPTLLRVDPLSIGYNDVGAPCGDLEDKQPRNSVWRFPFCHSFVQGCSPLRHRDQVCLRTAQDIAGLKRRLEGNGGRFQAE